MTDTNNAPKATPKLKRARHASAQATYMERKRAEGKEWLATWVPGEAKESFKALAKSANTDENAPSKSYIQAVEKAVGESAPDWAKANQTLLNLWLIAEHNVQIDFTAPTEKKPKKDKKHKEKKKKKK
ncbi:hypothetical protein MTBPR1_90123 [Candidatus Terasakiella magnetica]|uniref:Uncharacterized protein n=1 Tax=Candidatus Terasakiella magnetica TaxID=1867952 RepID=A0A1C3RLY5_9PROT|nr:hypothetical protein [Candidatus Terasakiella magnetica]SCA58276.1 hypothetical protein MTBPR1_90123 [Candidatus Terasakiella magnetica]